MKAKEGHSSLLDWGPLAACIGTIIAPWMARLFAPEQGNLRQILQWLNNHAAEISGLGIIAFMAWMLWHSFEQWDELNQKCNPRLALSCAPNYSVFAGDDLFLRLAIKSESDAPIVDCRASIIKIEKDGRQLWGDNSYPLLFSSLITAGDAVKVVSPDEKAYIEVLMLKKGTTCI